MDDNTLVAIISVALMVAVCVISVCGAVASRRPEPRPRSERFAPPMWTSSSRPAKEKREGGASDADA